MGCEFVATEASIDYMRRERVMTQTVHDLSQVVGTPRVHTVNLALDSDRTQVSFLIRTIFSSYRL